MLALPIEIWYFHRWRVFPIARLIKHRWHTKFVWVFQRSRSVMYDIHSSDFVHYARPSNFRIITKKISILWKLPNFMIHIIIDLETLCWIIENFLFTSLVEDQKVKNKEVDVVHKKISIWQTQQALKVLHLSISSMNKKLIPPKKRWWQLPTKIMWLGTVGLFSLKLCGNKGS